MKQFFLDLIKSQSGTSSKRFIALVLIGVIILCTIPLFFGLQLSEKSSELLSQLFDIMQFVILFTLGYSTIEKFKKPNE